MSEQQELNTKETNAQEPKIHNPNHNHGEMDDFCEECDSNWEGSIREIKKQNKLAEIANSKMPKDSSAWYSKPIMWPDFVEIPNYSSTEGAKAFARSMRNGVISQAGYPGYKATNKAANVEESEFAKSEKILKVALSIMDRVTDYSSITTVIYLCYVNYNNVETINQLINREHLTRIAFGQSTYDASISLYQLTAWDSDRKRAINCVVDLINCGYFHVSKPYKPALIVYIAARIALLDIDSESKYESLKNEIALLKDFARALQLEIQLSIFTSEVESAYSKLLNRKSKIKQVENRK